MKRLLKYTEIQTKITSLMTFILVILLLLYHNIPLKGYETLVFFAGMFIFDLTTTAINNYIDSKNNDQDFGLSRKTMKLILFTLLGISILFGLWLVVLTDIIVLLIGAFCFFVGIVYTFGPIAISRQPYGEIVSGVLYGYFIPFLLFYINLGEAFVSVSLSTTLSIHLNVEYGLMFLVFGIVPTLLTAAIMLGNNTCDLERDIKVNRFTLVYYIGQRNAIHLMYALYSLVYVGIILGVILGIYPIYMLGVLLSAVLALKHVHAFGLLCDKEKSFPYVIKNFIMIMMLMIVVLSVSTLI